VSDIEDTAMDARALLAASLKLCDDQLTDSEWEDIVRQIIGDKSETELRDLVTALAGEAGGLIYGLAYDSVDKIIAE
jgi:hypothetical protein